MLKFIKENKKSIKVFLFIFILGLASGILCFKYINIASNNELVDSFNKSIEIIKGDNIEKISIFSSAFINIGIIYLIVIISSITVITPIVLFIIYFLKGFSIGLLINVLFIILGFKQALIVIIFMVIIPNILNLSVLLFLSIKTIEFNYFILEKSDIKKKIKQSIVFFMYFVISSPINILSVFIEQLAIPFLIK